MARRTKEKKDINSDKELDGLDGGGRAMKEYMGEFNRELDAKNDKQKKQYVNDGIMMSMERILYGLVILVLFLKF